MPIGMRRGECRSRGCNGRPLVLADRQRWGIGTDDAAAGGYVEGRNVTVEYHWLEARYDRAPNLMADLVRRRVAVSAAAAFPPAVRAYKGF
jgi:hypothetical protein